MAQWAKVSVFGDDIVCPGGNGTIHEFVVVGVGQ